MTMYISCTCLFVICFCFTTGAVEAFLMVCSSLTSHFQGSIIFLMNMKVLLGILYLCSLGYPGSWCLQWPVWSLAVVSTSFCHHLFGACLPPTLTSSQFSCIAPIYTGSSFLPPILTSHFLLPFFCNASPPHFFLFWEEQCSDADPVRVFHTLCHELQYRPLMIWEKVWECSTGRPWIQDPPTIASKMLGSHVCS